MLIPMFSLNDFIYSLYNRCICVTITRILATLSATLLAPEKRCLTLETVRQLFTLSSPAKRCRGLTAPGKHFVQEGGKPVGYGLLTNHSL